MERKQLPREWDSEHKNKESITQRFEDDEEASSWIRLTQDEIDEIWTQLADAVEGEVLLWYSVKKAARWKYTMRGKHIG